MNRLLITIVFLLIIICLFQISKRNILRSNYLIFSDGYATNSFYANLYVDRFTIIMTCLEFYMVYQHKLVKEMAVVVIFVELPGMLICYLIGAIKGYFREGSMWVDKEYLNVGRKYYRYDKISLQLLKEEAKTKPPQHKEGSVYFYFFDTYIDIPINKFKGGYAFVNRLCDELKIERVNMD